MKKALRWHLKTSPFEDTHQYWGEAGSVQIQLSVVKLLLTVYNS